MLLQKELNQDAITIQSYQPGKIKISGNTYQQAILITSSELKGFEQANLFSELDIEQLIALLPQETEVVIIGCGEKQQFLAQKDIKRVNDLGIALEVMGTRQACHTFQVLTYEQRKVVTLLFP